MLVLSRKIGERICIDGDISVEVLRCKNGRVKIGIIAPASKKIVRMEMVDHSLHQAEDVDHSHEDAQFAVSSCGS